jgi:formate C-acetyltransferase
MNERIKKLREQSLNAVPRISIERALIETEVYKKYLGEVSTPVLRALVFKNILEKKELCINDGELIIGERGEKPAYTPTYPELCCHTLKDFEIMHNREKISFKVSDEIRKIQEESIIPYWEKKSIRHKIFENMDEKWKQCYEAGIFTEFMEQRGPGHTVADDKIYKKGFKTFIEEIKKNIDNLDFINDKEAYEKKEELLAMIITCEAIINFAKRYSKYCLDLSEKELDETRRQELIDISKICLRVPENAPETFHEALQMYWFIHIGVITEMNNWDSFCPGRLDQHLYPFYFKDLRRGILSKEKAKELLRCFWIKFNNQPAPPKVGITLKESATYTDFSNINIGGLDKNGLNGVNEVSFLLLEVIDEMRLLQPSSNVQISKETPNDFLTEALKIVRKGWGQPSIFNTDIVIKEMINAGKNILDARCGGISGCVETGAFGKEAYILTGYFNLTKVLEITLNNGIDPVTGEILGLQLECSFSNYEELFEAYKKQLKYFIDIKIKGNQIIEKLYALYMPVPFLSVIIDDCIKNGKDYNNGGARYNINYIQGVGIGTITDSLSSIKYNIYEKKRFNFNELLEAMRNNFENEIYIYNILKNKTPKYGNDEDFADNIMKEIFEAFYEIVTDIPNIKGGHYRINMLPTTCHVYFGSVIKATPDGRKAFLPLSEGISPSKGADKNGPTGVIKSASKMPHEKTGGTLLNQKFTPQVLATNEGLEKLLHLIRSYFELGGHHIQFNVINRETLLNAQENPDDYRNLIVRVAGYSDYFNNLNKDLQDEIILRTEFKY